MFQPCLPEACPRGTPLPFWHSAETQAVYGHLTRKYPDPLAYPCAWGRVQPCCKAAQAHVLGKNPLLCPPVKEPGSDLLLWVAGDSCWRAQLCSLLGLFQPANKFPSANCPQLQADGIPVHLPARI